MESYQTIDGTAQAEYEEKKSRFIAQLAHVATEDEALAFLSDIRKANPMARHNVYAYVLREGNRVRYSDDGEPARTSGMPTLEVLRHAQLTDIICVTTRYFGGTLLGTGGLVRAYTKAAQDAVAAARIVTYAQCCDISVTIPYALYDSLQHWLAEQGACVVESSFTDTVLLCVRAHAHEASELEQAIIQQTHGQATLARGEESFQPMGAAQ